MGWSASGDTGEANESFKRADVFLGGAFFGPITTPVEGKEGGCCDSCVQSGSPEERKDDEAP